MKREQFTFSRFYLESLLMLSKKDQMPFLDAICKYSLFLIDDSQYLSERARDCFDRIRPIMGKEIRQSTEGRKCKEYKLWRKAVYERDHYTCQACGNRGVKLNAHHIKPYAYYIDARFDIENGITLCESCHKELHRRLSRGD